MILKLPQGHEGSEYMLSFEIGQREGGFYSERTDRITDTPSTVLVYRLLTFKRKQIIRDQNWFRVECELPQANLF